MTSHEHHLALEQERHDEPSCERCGEEKADVTEYGLLCGPCALTAWEES